MTVFTAIPDYSPPITWLAPWAGKVNRMQDSFRKPLPSERLSEPARWRYRDYPQLSRVKIVFVFHIINPLLTKLFRSRNLTAYCRFFCVFMDLTYILVHNHATKKRTVIINDKIIFLRRPISLNAAVVWDVTQWEYCVTSQKTAAKRLKKYRQF